MFVVKYNTRPAIATALTLLAAAPVATAQGPEGQTSQSSDSNDGIVDPPARVGRLSYLEGAVSFQPAGADQWAAAEPNRPVTTGDRVWADSTGRIEMDAGSAVLRLSTFTELDLVRLDDHWLQVRLPQGTVIERIKVMAGDQDNEVDAPNAAVALLSSGEYRTDVSGDGKTTTVTVWSGRAEVTAAGASFRVEAGQVARITGDSTPSYSLSDAGGGDDFDRWSSARDAREDAAAVARRYVSEDMPGEEDLDAYGSWEMDQAYGPVWYPTTIEAGWAPYRTGRWVWIAPWGWTWVDAAPWGFAPYHYGRWAYIGGRWGWCPGRTIVQPVFAPALVVFIGQPGWTTAAAFGGGGGVAWFPLAPGEVYYPTYATDVGYRRRINVATVTNVTHVTYVTNVTRVTNVTYRNRSVAQAVTVVPERVFTGAERVDRSLVKVAPRDLERAHIVGTAAPVAPTSASLGASTPGRHAPLPPPKLASRSVEATHAPPPPPTPFRAEQRAIDANGGRPLTPAQVTALHPNGAAREPTSGAFRSADAGSRGLGRPATPPPASPPPRAQPARPAPSPLERSYEVERTAVEMRHRQEFAHPSTGETPDALSRRQDAEDRDLERRYEQAQARDLPALPPRVEAKPAPRVEAKPAPQPQRPVARRRGPDRK